MTTFITVGITILGVMALLGSENKGTVDSNKVKQKFVLSHEWDNRWILVGNGEYLEIYGNALNVQEKAELRLYDLGYKEIQIHMHF